MNTKSFADTLQDLRYGTLHDELSEKMQEVVNACMDTKRVGSLTLKINFKPGKAGELEVTDKVTASIPELERGTSIMFVTPEGNLQREDPRQLTINGLKKIGKEDRPLKTV